MPCLLRRPCKPPLTVDNIAQQHCDFHTRHQDIGNRCTVQAQPEQQNPPAVGFTEMQGRHSMETQDNGVQALSTHPQR